MSDGNATTPTPKPETSEVKRAGGYPMVSLPKAVSMMQKVWEKEKRNAAPATTIVEHWGYAAKSSGGFSALASLKRFGLLEEVTGAATRSLKVSAMALDLLKYEGTDTAAYRKLLKSLALLPDWYQMMWNKYGCELPSDKTLESFLVFEQHLTEESAQQFIKLYKETISFAKLSESDMVEETKPPATENGDGKSKGSQTGDGGIKSKNSMEMIVNPGELPIPIAGKVALVPFPMTEEDFDLFIGTLKLWKKKLVRKLVSIPPSITLPASAIWSNNDADKQVKIVALMGERDGELYYKSDDGTGIPASQLKF
jgi:hypothetical protein